MSADQSPRAGDGNLQALIAAVRMGHADLPGLPAGDLLAAANVLRNNGHEDLAERLERKHEAERAALAAAPAVSAPAGWVSVNDRLPPKYTEVMIAFAGSALPSTGQYTDNKRDSEDGWSYPSENSGDDTDWTVTHWRPLPEHPEARRFAGSPDAKAMAAVQAPVTGDAA